MPVNKKIEIINKLGLHARAASKLVATASRFESKIALSHTSGQSADAKSIMSVLMLAASKGTLLHIEVKGQDENEALASICELINDRFGENE